MKINSKINIDTKELEKLIKAFKDEKLVKVGILGGSKKEGKTMASIGIIQEYGSIINNIPKRSFIKEPLVAHLKDFVFKHIPTIGKSLFIDKDVLKAYNVLGLIAVDIIQISFQNKNDGKWKANSPLTINGGWIKNKRTGKPVFIKGKGVDNPLILTGDLVRSITYKIIEKK